MLQKEYINLSGQVIISSICIPLDKNVTYILTETAMQNRATEFANTILNNPCIKPKKNSRNIGKQKKKLLLEYFY